MKRIISGLAATVAVGGLALGAALPGSAATVAPQQTAAVKYTTRDFDCWYHVGCLASAQLPSTWKHVKLSPHQDRFTNGDRMIRFDTAYGERHQVTTATAVKQKVAALKGTRGLKILGTSTVTMTSTTGQGRLAVSTVVYTYRAGASTRWVATRYVGMWGYRDVAVELSTGGAVKDSKLLGAVLNRATLTLALAG